MRDTISARLQLKMALEKSLVPSELHRASELHLLLGIAAFMENDDTIAQKHFQNALALEPKNRDARLNLAVSLYRSGDREKTVEILNELRTESISDILRAKIDEFLE